jgi:hypothetical protein
MLKSLFTVFIVIAAWVAPVYAQDSTSVAAGGSNYFLQFVKKVYLNPTILLKTQDFRAAHNVRVMVLPDMNGQTDNAITGFERALQKIIRFLIEGDDAGTLRLYFDINDAATPYSVVYSDEIDCKFTSADKDSVLRRLNMPFQGVAFTIHSSSLFEKSLKDGLYYLGNCLQETPAECGEKPDYKTTEINTKPLAIGVYNTTGSHYDIDHKAYDLLESNYAKAFDLHTQSDWYAPAKVVVASGSDEPVAIAISRHEALFKQQNLSFRTTYNDEVIPIASGNSDTVKIILPKTLPVGDPVEVVVKYKSPVDSITYTVGFFMVYVYEPQPIVVNVIGVNNYNIGDHEEEIALELQKIYGPLGVTFTINPKVLMPVSDWPTEIEIESSGLLSNYPPDLRDYVGAVKDLTDYDKDEYYLVFGLSTAELNGYMPRARNIGFVFTSGDAGKTAAHELGHGVFHLRHIFAEEELGLDAYKQTENVMDYAAGLKDLYVHQWQYIDDPAFVSWTAGDDEEAALSVGQRNGVPEGLLNDDKKSVSFITPGGEVISFNIAGLKGFYFKYVSDKFTDFPVPIGVLTYFTYYGKSYEAQFTMPDIQTLLQQTTQDPTYVFKGYKPVGNTNGEAYVDLYRDSLADSAKHTACMLIHESYQLEYWRFKVPALMNYAGRYAGGASYTIAGGQSFPVRPYDNVKFDIEHYHGFTNINNLTSENRVHYGHLRTVLAAHSLAERSEHLYAIHNQVLDICSFEPEILYLFSAKEKIFRWDEEGFWEGAAEGYTEYSMGVDLNSDFDELMENNEMIAGIGKPLDLFRSDPATFYRKLFIPRYYNFKTHLEQLIGNFWNTFDEAKFTAFPTPVAKQQYINLLRVVLNVTPVETLKALNTGKKNLAVKVLTSTNQPFTGIWEDALVKLLTGITKTDATSFLNTLEGGHNFAVNSTETTNLTQFIADNVHNVGFGEQYTEVAIQLGRIAMSDQVRMDQLKTRIMGEGDIDKYVVPFYHTNFWSEVKTGFNPWAEPTFETYSELGVSGGVAKVTFQSYKYDMGGSFYLPVVAPLATAFEVVQAPVTLNAFDLIIIENKTKDIQFTDFSAATGGEVNGIYPAFVLNYMDDEATSKKITDGVEAAVDVASIALGVGPMMTGLRTFRGFVALMDVASSGLNLTNNATGRKEPALDFINTMFGVANMALSVKELHNNFKNKAGIAARTSGVELPTGEQMHALVGKLLLTEGGRIPTATELSAFRRLLNSEDLDLKLKAYVALKRYEIDLRLAKRTGTEEYQLLKTLKKEVGNDWKNILKLKNAAFDWSQIAGIYRSTVDELMTVGRISGSDIVIGEQVIGTISGSTLRIPLETTTTYTSAVRFFPKMTFKFGEAAIDGKPLLLVRKASGQYACLVQGACFAAATPVRTSTGFSPIESIQAGDSVLSYNEADGAFVYSRVLNTFVKTTQQLVRIVVGQDTLLTTPEHLFRTTNAEWYTAGALFPGMSLVMAGGPGTVVSMQWIDSTLTVYNFEVAETHTYTVGLSQTVVHNSCTWFAKIQGISVEAIDKLKKLHTAHPTLMAKLEAEMGTNGAKIEKFLENIEEAPEILRRFLQGSDETFSEMQKSVDEWVRLQRQLATSNNQLREFNTATILYDKLTGKYYYGANRGIFVSGTEIHPTLTNKLPKTSTNAYKLGNCAECDAVNQALRDGANWGDLQMHTVGVEWNTGKIFPKPLCSNCEITFIGIEIVH